MAAMSWEDYLEDTKANAMYYIDEAIRYAAEEGQSVGDFDSIFSDMLNDDGVTGNGSGSYTYDRAKAEENIASIVTDSDFRQALRDAAMELPEDAEGIDVAARIAALEELSSELEEYFESVA